MSIFGKIRDAIFGHEAAPAAAAASPKPATPAPQPKPAAPQAMPQMGQPKPQPVPTTVSAAPAAPVDVEAVLTGVATQKGNPDLNWRSSIVDLMKLLDLESSLDNRKELATELGYTGAKDGSAEMNIWLHKAVMDALAKHGGTVPMALKD